MAGPSEISKQEVRCKGALKTGKRKGDSCRGLLVAADGTIACHNCGDCYHLLDVLGDAVRLGIVANEIMPSGLNHEGGGNIIMGNNDLLQDAIVRAKEEGEKIAHECLGQETALSRSRAKFEKTLRHFIEVLEMAEHVGMEITLESWSGKSLALMRAYKDGTFFFLDGTFYKGCRPVSGRGEWDHKARGTDEVIEVFRRFAKWGASWPDLCYSEDGDVCLGTLYRLGVKLTKDFESTRPELLDFLTSKLHWMAGDIIEKDIIPKVREEETQRVLKELKSEK